MKVFAILLIISMAVMSLHTQALTKKPVVKGKVKVHVKAKAPSAKLSLGAKLPKAKATGKVGLKINSKAAAKPKSKLSIKVKSPKLGGKAKIGGKAKLHIGIGAKAKTGAKVHIKINAKKPVAKAPTCKSSTNMFGIKMITGPAKTTGNMCKLKYSCCDAASYKTTTDRMNGFAKKLGSWVWSKATLAKWVNFATTKLDYVKVNKLCGNGKTVAPKAKVTVKAKTGDKKTTAPKVKVAVKAKKTMRLLQALKAKAKAPKVKVSVKAKKPVAKAGLKIKVGAKKPVAKAGLKIKVGAKKPVAKTGLKIKVGAKKPVVKGKAGLKVKVGAKKPVVKAHIKIHMKVKAAGTFKLGGNFVHTGKEWDALVIDNKKCNGVFMGFMKLAKVCARNQSAYGEAVKNCSKGLYKLRKNLMCNSCNANNKSGSFANGTPKLSAKGWKKVQLGSCLMASMFEDKCLRPQLRLMNTALKTFNTKAADFTTQINGWESMKSQATAKAACLKTMTGSAFFTGFNAKAKVGGKAKLHIKIGAKAPKAGLKIKVGAKKPVVKGKAGLKIKVGAKKPVVKAPKVKVAVKAKAGLKVKAPKVKVAVKAKKTERVLQAMKVKAKAPKVKVSVKAKKPVAKAGLKIKVGAKKPVAKAGLKIKVGAKKPVVKGKAGLKVKVGAKAPKAGLKIHIGAKKPVVKGKAGLKVKVGAKAPLKPKVKVTVKKFNSKWFAAVKSLGAYKRSQFKSTNYQLTGKCLAAIKPFLWANVKSPVDVMKANTFVYQILDASITAWASEANVASYWKKFYVAALKDSSSYTSATANAPKVKVTVKGKTGAKVTVPKVKIAVKGKTGAKVAAPKVKVAVKGKTGAKVAAPKVKVAVKAKKDLRRMQAAPATTTPATTPTTPATTTTGGMDVSTDADAKSANQAPLVVAPGPGQETPFSASSNLVKTGIAFVSAILLALM